MKIKPLPVLMSTHQHSIILACRVAHFARNGGPLRPERWPTWIGISGPLGSEYALARFWDNMVITSAESLGLRAINLTENEIDGIAAVGEPNGRLGREGRRIMVKVSNSPRYIPLNSLGDGTIRSFATVLALAHSSGGFLIIDEVENGIHHSALRGFWSMMLEAAQRYNVQVLATTHSFDCVGAFARAAIENEEAEGALIRLEGRSSTSSGVFRESSRNCSGSGHRSEIAACPET